MLEELDIMGDPVEEAVMTLVDKEDRLRGVDEPVSCCVDTPPRVDLLGRAKAFRGGIVCCWIQRASQRMESNRRYGATIKFCVYCVVEGVKVDNA
jgi:hypothetical protein